MPDRTPKRRSRTTPRPARRRASKTEACSSSGTDGGAHLRGPGEQAEIILETSPLGIVMVDGVGQIVRTNGRLEQMFGYQRGELVGEPLEALLPERFRAIHGRHRGTFFDDPHVRPMGLGLDLVARRKDGREFPVEISLSYIRTANGTFALAFVSDITPRRNVERRLQAEFAVTRVLSESRAPE